MTAPEFQFKVEIALKCYIKKYGHSPIQIVVSNQTYIILSDTTVIDLVDGRTFYNNLRLFHGSQTEDRIKLQTSFETNVTIY